MGFTDGRVPYSAQKLNGTSLIQTGKRMLKKKKKEWKIENEKENFQITNDMFKA